MGGVHGQGRVQDTEEAGLGHLEQPDCTTPIPMKLGRCVKHK